jgi:FtsZ-binding cell division protein ZapB
MKSGKKGARCRLCSSTGADRMRLLDFEAEEQPLCLACVRPYDQGLKAGSATAQQELDRLVLEVRRLSEQTGDYLDQLQRTHVQMETLRAENKQLRERLGEWMKSDEPGEDAPTAKERD